MAEFKPVPVERWGGLNLQDDEAEVALNGAIDLLNVDFDRRGRVRTRDGYNDFVSAVPVPRIRNLHPYFNSTAALEAISSPAPTNPSFDVDTSGWSLSGGGSITRDTVVFDSAPASGSWTSGSTLSAAFTGTFAAGVTYVLTFSFHNAAAGRILRARFGLVATDYAESHDTTVAGVWTSVQLEWTPTADRTGVTLALAQVSGAASTYNVDTLALFNPTGAKQLLLGGEGAPLTRALSSAGATVADDTTYSATQFVNWSAPGSTVAYAVTDTASLLKWDGSAFSNFAVQGTNVYTAIAVQPNDNRLVVGGRSDYSEVRFSDAGAPETWTADNFVNVTPGDGETITAMVTWRDLVFVFKRSKFFVFYGNSTDVTGGAVFNYRTVATGRGALGLHTVCAAPDGVYFVDRSGIYRTTGGVPELVSGAMSPLFERTAGEFYTGPELAATDSAAASALHWHRDRLYLSFPTTGLTPSHTLVYDLRTGTWSLWDLAAGAFASWDTSDALTSASSLFFTSGDTVYELSPSYTDDNGTAITSRYRTGFFTPAGATVPSTIREVLMDGTGTVNVKGSSDYGDLGTASAVSLGVSPAIVQNRAVAANYGRFHSYEFSSTTGPFTLNRATFHVESKSPVGKQP